MALKLNLPGDMLPAAWRNLHLFVICVTDGAGPGGLKDGAVDTVLLAHQDTAQDHELTRSCMRVCTGQGFLFRRIDSSRSFKMPP